MKRSLTPIAAILIAISLAGCSAKGGAFSGKDVGGTGKTADGIFGIEGGATDAAAGGMALNTAEAAPSAGKDIAADPSATIPTAPEPQAGMLTGGEWNDNDHWSDWQALYTTHNEWNAYQQAWKNTTLHRVAVTVTTDGETPLAGATVSGDGFENSAVTDNKGRAYLFFSGETAPGSFDVSCGGESCSVQADWVDPSGDQTIGVTLENARSPVGDKLDLMIMCDTTGSMSDELEYLKAELEDIVLRVKNDNANLPVRTSVNFYRDEGDVYVVRRFPFTDNIEQSVSAIRKQTANGGGDFPEAVHTALENALNDHDWDEDSVKIMFLVLDAPPHSDPQIVDSVNKSVKEAAARGIRIVPIASSGIDKSTEYVLRTMAFTTGGTYTFLTNDSGIGNDHIEPTVGAFNVERLSDMMVRIVNAYLD